VHRRHQRRCRVFHLLTVLIAEPDGARQFFGGDVIVPLEDVQLLDSSSSDLVDQMILAHAGLSYEERRQWKLASACHPCRGDHAELAFAAYELSLNRTLGCVVPVEPDLFAKYVCCGLLTTQVAHGPPPVTTLNPICGSRVEAGTALQLLIFNASAL